MLWATLYVAIRSQRTCYEGDKMVQRKMLRKHQGRKRIAKQHSDKVYGLPSLTHSDYQIILIELFN